MANYNIELSKDQVEDLKVLIDMNFGDYLVTIADQHKHEDLEEEQKAIEDLRKMMKILYVLGTQVGIDVRAYDVDGLLPLFGKDVL